MKRTPWVLRVTSCDELQLVYSIGLYFDQTPYRSKIFFWGGGVGGGPLIQPSSRFPSVNKGKHLSARIGVLRRASCVRCTLSSVRPVPLLPPVRVRLPALALVIVRPRLVVDAVHRAFLQHAFPAAILRIPAREWGRGVQCNAVQRGGRRKRASI